MNKQEIKAWLTKHKVKKYTINDDLTVDVDGIVYLGKFNLASLPFQFGTINGCFFCHNNKLTSLKNCPKVVLGDFWCYHNKLTSLEHCPKVVHGYFDCDEALLKEPNYQRWLLAKKLKEL